MATRDWTDIINWSQGVLVSVDSLNEQWANNLTWLHDPQAVRLEHDSDQSIPASTFTTLTYGLESYDNDGVHGTANPTRLVAPRNGRYMTISHYYQESAAGGGTAEGKIIKTSGTVTSDVAFRNHANGAIGGNVGGYVHVADVVTLTADDYVETQAWQNGSGAHDVTGDPVPQNTPIFAMSWLGSGDAANADWTTPRDWVDNELVTAPNMNVHVRSNLKFLDLHEGCKLTRSAAQSIPDSTATAIQFTTEEYDDNAMFDSGSNTRITIKRAGKFTVLGKTEHASNAVGLRYLYVKKNGSNLSMLEIDTALNGLATKMVVMPQDFEFAVDDYLELFVYQTSGDALNVTNSSFSVHFVHD